MAKGTREPAKTVCPSCGKRAVGREGLRTIYCEHCGATMATRPEPR